MGRRVLTDRKVNSLKAAPKGKRRMEPDGIVPGMWVRVTDTGTKTYVLVARYPTNPKFPTPRSLGEVGAITLADARDKARTWLELIQKGIDPKVEEARQRASEGRRQATTWDGVVADYLDQHGSKLAKAAEAKSILLGEFGALWKGRPAGDITPLEAAHAVKTIVQRGAPAQARNALGYGRAFYAWAIGTHLYNLEVNPFAAINADALTGPKTKRKRILSDAELSDVWHAAGEMGQPYGPLVRLLILLGQRRDEIGEGSWPEIYPADWRDNPKIEPSLVIPPDRMKMDSAHVVPLVAVAADIFRGIATGERGSFIFTTTDGELPVDGYSKAKDRLDVLMMKRHEAEVVARPGRTLAVSIATQREAAGKEVSAIAAGHAPFKSGDVGRVVGIRHGARWGYVRVTEFKSAKHVDVRILSSFDAITPSAEWAIGPDHWTFHDLRRTMRTHLSALPVQDLVRELVIAHAKPGLHQVYDQWSYAEEKRHALDLWAARLRDIVEPPPANVASIKKERQRRAEAS
jgi:integrase